MTPRSTIMRDYIDSILCTYNALPRYTTDSTWEKSNSMGERGHVRTIL